jgi:type IV pilus assembly protein PilC
MAIQHTHCFPPFVIQMIKIGEESGTLDTMLSKIAAVYEHDIDQIADTFGQLLEPLMVILLGTLVGGLIIAMYLPVFNLMTIIG